MKWGFLILGISALLTGCQPGTGEFSMTEEIELLPATTTSDLLSKIQNDIFTPICAECHTGSQAPLGLRLENTELAYQFLVNVQAIGNSQFKRVLPEDSENSFLNLKISGDPQAGQRMPLGKAPLSAENIQLIRDWIDQGAFPAENSKTLASVSKVSEIIETLSQSNQQGQSQLQRKQYLIEFTQPMDTLSINQQSIRLFENFADDTYLVDTNNYQLNILSDRTVKLSIDYQYLQSGISKPSLKIIIDDSLGNPIIDFRGMLLDGNENQQQGGRYEFNF